MCLKNVLSHFVVNRLGALFASVPVAFMLATVVSPHAAANCNESSGAAFIRLDRGQVADNANGMTWQRCLVGKTWNEASAQCTGSARSMTWDAAVDYVKGLKPTADGAWRLPTAIELMTLVDFKCRGSDRRLNWFGDSDSRVLWSSEVYKPTADYAWGLSFEKAELIYQLRMDEFQLLLIKAKK